MYSWHWPTSVQFDVPWNTQLNLLFHGKHARGTGDGWAWCLGYCSTRALPAAPLCHQPALLAGPNLGPCVFHCQLTGLSRGVGWDVAMLIRLAKTQRETLFCSLDWHVAWLSSAAEILFCIG